MAQLPPQSVIDARYRAKLDARATGATPVMVEVPPDTTPENLDQRAREKLARLRQEQRGAAPAKPAAPVPVTVAKEEAKPAESEAPAPAEQSEPSRDGQRHEQHRRNR